MENGRMGAGKRWMAFGVLAAVAGCGLPFGPAAAEHDVAAADGADGAATAVEDFDSALRRLGRGPCPGLFWQHGTCQAWLVVIESTGYSAVVSYFDRDTLALVGRTHINDVGLERHELEPIDCSDVVITETIPCID